MFRRSHRVVAVQDVSFSVRRGEAVALVGESGSGKSTIARMLVRLSQPDGGEIRLDGVDVLASEPRGASLGSFVRIQASAGGSAQRSSISPHSMAQPQMFWSME